MKPESFNPLKAVGTIQRSQSSWIAARAVGALIPLSFEMNVLQPYRDGVLLRRQFLTVLAVSSTHWIAGRYEKPWLTAKWARSYHKPDPATSKLWSFGATPCHIGYMPLAH